MSHLATYRALGFDLAEHVPFTRQYRIACSSCEALVINGYPTHERGCPQAMHECGGCNELIPINRKYCEECAT